MATKLCPHIRQYVQGRWCVESSHRDGDDLHDHPDPLANVVGHEGLVDSWRCHVVVGDAGSGWGERELGLACL